MSNTIENKNLDLYLPNGQGKAFYLQELHLHEGLSRIPRAQLTLHSSTLFSMQELNALLTQNAVVKLMQERDKQELARWFGGMVTAVEHLGVMQETQSETTYGYQMTLEPSLVNLCYASHNRSFNDQTPKEVINTLLQEADIVYDLQYLKEENTHCFTQKTRLFQNSESDYAFLLRIFSSCGISFIYQAVPYDATTDGTVVKPPVLYLFAGQNYQPASPMAPPLPKECFPLPFHSRNRVEAGYALLDWKMCSRIGVDAVNVSYQTADGTIIQQNSGDGTSSRSLFFNHAPLGTLTADSIQTVTDNYLKVLKLHQANWIGKTICLEAMPGTSIQVLEFYGAKNTTAINALVTEMELKYRAPMDPLLDSADNLDADLSITINCINASEAANFNTQPKAPRRSVALSSGETQREQTNAQEVSTANSTQNNTPSSQVKFYQAAVCNSNGTYTNKNSESCLTQNTTGNKNYRFNAHLLASSNASDVISVILVMPLAGTGQGLFRVPRIGERILVASVDGNDYYLMGYLPCDDMSFAGSLTDPDDIQGSINDSIMLRYYETTSGGTLPSYASNADDTIPERYNEVGKTPKYSELGFYTLKDSEDNNQETLNLQSTGDVRLSATDNIEFSSNNVSFTGITADKAGYMKIVSFRKLVVDVEESIALCVGKSAILITQDKIILVAERWSQTPGPLESTILLNALSGVVITGMNCVMKGSYSTCIVDGAGAGLSISAGNASLNGVAVRLATLKRSSLLANCITTIVYLGEEIAGFIVGATASASTSKTFDKSIGVINRFVDGTIRLVRMWNIVEQTYSSDSPYAGANTAAAVCNLLASFTDLLLVCVDNVLAAAASVYDESIPSEAKKAAEITGWMDQPINGSCVTNRDAFRLTSAGLLSIGWIINVIVAMITAKQAQKAEVKINGTGIQVEARNYDNATVEQEINNSVDAGKQELNDRHQQEMQAEQQRHQQEMQAERRKRQERQQRRQNAQGEIFDLGNLFG